MKCVSLDKTVEIAAAVFAKLTFIDALLFYVQDRFKMWILDRKNRLPLFRIIKKLQNRFSSSR